MTELLSKQFRKAIEDSEFTDDNLANLYEAVDGMSDEEFKKYMYVNRDTFNKTMPLAIEGIAGFQNYVSEEPSYGEKSIDYEKVTGSPDALSDEKFYSYNMKDMDYFGSKVGMTGREFLQKMKEDKIANDRNKIAKGEDEGGWFESPKSFAKNLGGAAMSLLAPRSQEAIARGEEPTDKDYINDTIQNALYVGAGRIPYVGDAVAPAVMETLDYLAYNDDENNPRGQFSVGDIAKGTLVNRFGGKRIQPRLEKAHIPGAAAGFITNELGDALYGNKKMGQIPMMIPGANIAAKAAQDYLDEDISKTKREKAKKEAENKYKGKLTRKQLLGE